MNDLSKRVHTFGQDLRARYGERVHKIALDAGFTCPNRDSSRGISGCTFCNNRSFAPGVHEPATLERVNRGHGFAEYAAATRAARSRGIPVCCHLIVGLPGEDAVHSHASLARVLEVGVDGLKLHPLHVVKHTRLAIDWKRGLYRPLAEADYIGLVADLIERTPWPVVFHRVTGTAPPDMLLAPAWCARKWDILNGIAATLAARGSRQGTRADAHGP